MGLREVVGELQGLPKPTLQRGTRENSLSPRSSNHQAGALSQSLSLTPGSSQASLGIQSRDSMEVRHLGKRLIPKIGRGWGIKDYSYKSLFT